MKITKDLAWVREYVDLVRHLLPKIKQLKRISSRKGNESRYQHCHGIITYFDKKSYRITLYTNYFSETKQKLIDYSTIDVLCYLAHELAHLEHWEHTPAHKHLEAIIIGIFMTKLAQDGYGSEEIEEKQGLFYKEFYD